MESEEGKKKNPLKRSSETLTDLPSSEPMDIDASLEPTDYQMKVVTAAVKRNTVAVLETEVGKTMMSVMLIKEVGESLKRNVGDKKLIVFLAPTVHLVHQQCKEIKSHTKLQVEEYYGAKGVDDWNAEIWQKEINEHDVLVMTPQILLDALRKSFLNFETFCLIVLDECHHAIGNHPYAKIMKEFYHKSANRPKIFGMTDSPVMRKSVSSIKYSGEQIIQLESLLDSRVYYTIEDTMEQDEFIWAPKQTCRFYEPLLPPPMDVTGKLESSLHKFDAVLLDTQTLASEYKDNDDKYKTFRERLADDHEKILFCLRSLGFVSAYEAVKICLENVPKVQEKCEFYSKSITQYESSLQEALSIIEASCPGEHKRLVDVVNGGSDAADTGLISSKLHELLEIFRTFRKATEVLCIVFFERIIAAEVVERVIKKVTDLSHFNITCLTGSNYAVVGPKAWNEAIESLHFGKVNLLFSTDVVEEGYQVPKFSYVIYFDLPKTVCRYVQSPGQFHLHDSQYIIMLERGNNKQIDQVSYITKIEISMTHTAMNRDPDGCVETCTTNEEAVYSVNATGASVTADSSISFIDRYCKKLPRDKYFVPEPTFEFLQEGNLYRCKLVLPPNAAFQTMIGPVARNSHMSKQLVCLDACKKLQAMGDLIDHLLPYNEESPKKDCMTNVKVISSGAGTTKRKELHGSVSVQMLSGTLGDKLDGATFYAYKMKFSCNLTEQKFSSFVLLLEAKLDSDVGNIEVELYLIAKFVRSSVSFSGLTNLDAKQVAKAKCFQELIFNSLFGKLFVKSSSGEKMFLLNTKESLWNSSNNYLLVPLESVDEASQECVRINWTGIDSCVSAVEFLKKNAWLNFKQTEAIDKNSSAHVKDLVVTQLDNNVIHLANRSASVDNLKGMVVVAIHTGRIYSILDALADTSGESPFEGETETSYSSFADYYKKRYNILLKYPEQPLLLLKQSHNSHNLLVDFRNEGASRKHKPKGGGKNVVRKPNQPARIPPELLIGTDLRTDVMKSFYLLPSLMHRMESLMLASQLRLEIARHTGELNIPSSVILEALTTLRCMERFSMERLELLGDAVLKYAVSCHLFLKYPKKHEGQLSSHRSRIVSNSKLHKFGVERQLQGYIRDCAFDPRQWTAPGQRSIWPSPCNHCVDTREVPLDEKFFTEDVKIMVGNTCSKGHRWMGSKTISDSVEALIGAYYVGGGLTAALSLMKWLGIETELEPSLIDDAIKAASLRSYAPHIEAINILESKIDYKFNVKGLVLEALTHATEGFDHCYQRLEFLGDSVLDILIMRHLYERHKDIDPGELTDLRSASVNNNNFAFAAVRHNLHPHLLHQSECLRDQISSFVKSVSGMSSKTLTPENIAPKALGDLVESIVGAILIDSKLDLDEVWKVVEPLLSPIVTPEKLELPPSRELIELCDSLGYFVKEYYTPKGDAVHAELTLQLESVLLNGQGSGPNRKAAKGMAALCLLKKLEARGISSSKRKHHQPDQGSDGNIRSSTFSECSDHVACKKHKTTQPNIPSDQLNVESTENASDSKNLDIPVVPPVNMKKGGPRISLYSLCKKLQWPLPSFDTREQKSRIPIQFGDDVQGFSSFESEISLIIPDLGVIKLEGEARADKKSSFDSAALLMMNELERLGKIIISE